jgi:uncharacterized phage protein (TIGR02218 family)
MRTVAAPLQAHLAAGRQGWMAGLYTITLASGTVLRWTDSDRALTWGGQTYVLGPGLERGPIRRSLGLDVDEMRISVIVRPTDLVGTTALALALRRGDFDRATVQLDRAYGDVPGTIIGVIDRWFLGRLGPISGNGFEFSGTVRSLLADLDVEVPRNVVQAQCGNRLFDDVCGLNPASFRATGTVTGGITASPPSCFTTLTAVDAYYTHGRIRWLTGANAGRSQTVRGSAQSSGFLVFSSGWPDPVAIGDTFEIWAGCSKTLAICSSRFNNVGRFRGMPFVPAPETTT